MTQIDKGIPLPPERNNLKYPWHDVAVGDSFLYRGNIRAAQSATAYWCAEAAPKVFRARILDDKVRVWRIK